MSDICSTSRGGALNSKPPASSSSTSSAGVISVWEKEGLGLKAGTFEFGSGSRSTGFGYAYQSWALGFLGSGFRQQCLRL